MLSPTCWLWRRDNEEEDGGDDDQRNERTTSLKNVCWLYYLSVVVFFCCYLFGLPHAGYGRGIMTRRMVVATTGRTDNIAEERTFYLSVVCFFGLPHAAWLWWRDNEKEDGGDDNGTRGQHHRRKYVGYAPCLLFVVVFLSLCCLRMLANGGRTATRRVHQIRGGCLWETTVHQYSYSSMFSKYSLKALTYEGL